MAVNQCYSGRSGSFQLRAIPRNTKPLGLGERPLSFVIFLYLTLQTNLTAGRRPLGETPLHAGAPGALPVPRHTRDVSLNL